MSDPTADLLGGLDAAAGVRCPSCSATLRPGAPWCTLCYTDLRPKAELEVLVRPEAVEPLPVAVPVLAAYGLPAPDPLTGPVPHPVPHPGGAPTTAVRPEATWPCVTCGADNALTASTCGACGAGFLAGLRAREGPLLELPVVGDLGAMSRAQRLGLAFGAVLAVLALVAVLGLLSS